MSDDAGLIERALAAADDTKALLVEDGARQRAAELFVSQFGASPAMIVADEASFAAVGRDVYDSFRRAGHAVVRPQILPRDILSDEPGVELVRRVTAGAHDAVPVAVGAGTVNDLVKLAVHQLGRPYMAVATAASMDGYTAFGASITHRGSKQTFPCPAPRAVIADMESIAAAPRHLNAAGYADLIAKLSAGADWMIADALGIEAIHPAAWQTVQAPLRAWVASPEAIARNDRTALRQLVLGLMLSGFAMQAAKSSRPASGADHQFSHLWDMQLHTHEGYPPSHGFKVGIGTLASCALYEELFQMDLDRLDVTHVAREACELDALHVQVDAIFDPGELREKAHEVAAAKYLEPGASEAHLQRIRSAWPQLHARLRAQLIRLDELQAMLREAGCAHKPQQIGISHQRLQRSYQQAFFIRRRYTVLDLAVHAGAMEQALAKLFSPDGRWPLAE